MVKGFMNYSLGWNFPTCFFNLKIMHMSNMFNWLHTLFFGILHSFHSFLASPLEKSSLFEIFIAVIMLLLWVVTITYNISDTCQGRNILKFKRHSFLNLFFSLENLTIILMLGIEILMGGLEIINIHQKSCVLISDTV